VNGSQKIACGMAKQRVEKIEWKRSSGKLQAEKGKVTTEKAKLQSRRKSLQSKSLKSGKGKVKTKNKCEAKSAEQKSAELQSRRKSQKMKIREYVREIKIRAGYIIISGIITMV
jgi:hypothetical protein